ncbi:MAG TPA: hypothetical protein VFI35_08055 [Actinomycetota bacterium]|nr:hypothetical protein [Actinomycetota bacterium]
MPQVGPVVFDHPKVIPIQEPGRAVSDVEDGIDVAITFVDLDDGVAFSRDVSSALEVLDRMRPVADHPDSPAPRNECVHGKALTGLVVKPHSINDAMTHGIHEDRTVQAVRYPDTHVPDRNRSAGAPRQPCHADNVVRRGIDVGDHPSPGRDPHCVVGRVEVERQEPAISVSHLERQDQLDRRLDASGSRVEPNNGVIGEARYPDAPRSGCDRLRGGHRDPSKYLTKSRIDLRDEP